MIALSINKLTKSFGATTIFEGLSMDVKEGERLGLIGPNGCGKTTLLKILMSQEDYSEGTVAYKKGITVGYLNQLPDYEETMKVRDVMTLAFLEVKKLRHRMTEYEASFATLDGSSLDKALKAYGDLSHQFEEKGGYEIDTQLNIIAEGLQIPESMQQQTFGQLSGGEKTRVELAKTLLEAPDVLLLDEPSNHLDMVSIEWLEDFLKAYSGTAIVVSHDRYFLDRVVTRIVEMSYDKLAVFHGNYSWYVVEKERRFLIDMKFYLNQQKQVKRVEDQIKRYRVWGTMRDSEKMFKKAKELEKRLEKMDKMDRPKFDNAKVKFAFNTQNRSGKRVLEVKGLEKAFEDKGLFKDASFDLFFGESLCLIGKNGSGKSTILKMLIQEAIDEEYVWINHQDIHDPVQKDGGTIHFGSRVKIGYLAQEVAFEEEDKTILKYFTDLHDLSDPDARHELAKVLFVKDDINKKIGSLSGGEKSRLKLCSLMYDQVNLMILDEPTNHLDIDSREILEETLIGFQGTILFVSHDRYFIAKIANRMAEIEEETLQYYGGNFDDYREEKAKKLGQGIKPNVSKGSGQESDPKGHQKTEKVKDAKKVPQKYLKEYEELEAAIGNLEHSQEALAEEMDASASDVEKLGDLYSKSEALENDLSIAIERWEELSEIIGGYK